MMRLVSIALLVELGEVLHLMLPVDRRQMLAWQWALTTVLFLRS
jgi:hypothetical protein